MTKRKPNSSAIGIRLMALAAVLLLPFAALAGNETSSSRPSIGLALSGGGARGLSHIGVLKVLEQNNIKVDYVAGTSMGAIIGGLYAAGYSADQIETMVSGLEWSKVLADDSQRQHRSMRQKIQELDFQLQAKVGFNGGDVQLPLGAIQGQRLGQLLNRLTLPIQPLHDFDQLQIPFRAVATDLVSGREVVLKQGSFPEALRASMSVPGVFAPVEWEDMLLVDGGLANNLPVSVVREMGADLVIAVDVSMPLFPREMLDSVLRVTEQITSLMTRNNTEQQIATLGDTDLLIIPNLTQVGSASFDLAEHAINVGRVAAEQAIADNGNLYVGSARGRAAAKPADAPWPQIEYVELQNLSGLDKDILLSRLDLQLGQPLDVDQLEKDLEVLYGLDAFQRVSWELLEDSSGKHGIRISAIPHSWGPNYLEFGLNLSDDFSGNSEYALGMAYTRTNMNRLGGELRSALHVGFQSGLSFDFYQPLDRRASWFFNPVAAFNKRELNLFSGEQQLAELSLTASGISLGAGRNFGTSGQLRLDYLRFKGDFDVITGAGDLPADEFDLGELVLSGIYDTLDDINFPRQGHQLFLGGRFASRSLGADSDYEQIFGRNSMAKTWGRHTLLWQNQGGYTLDDNAPLERVYELGGFGNLSGLVPNQLNGQHYFLSTLAFYRRLGNIEFLPAYAGFSLELGNVWQRSGDIGFSSLRKAGSLFLGADSPVGPVYLAYGLAEGGDNTFYLFLGNPFTSNSRL